MEQEEPLELVSMEKMRSWYEEVSNDLVASISKQLPPFGQRTTASRSCYCPIIEKKIPFGDLFYPCCGPDTAVPMSLFGDCVRTCIFADCKRLGRVVYPTNDSKRYGIGAIRVADSWELNPPLRGHKNAISFVKDGLACFLEDVNELSVFFYRGDSTGEGGSDQRWLGPTLFNAVLAKLQTGGLIVTDGSNCGYLEEYMWGEYVPWNAMAGLKPFQPPTIGARFDYADWSFECLAGPFTGGHHGRKAYVWQGR